MTTGTDQARSRTPQASWKKPAGFFLMMAAGGVLGFFAVRLFKDFAALRSALDTLTAWDLLVLPLLWLLAVGLHEAGHLAGGLRRGMRFLLYIVGPLGWVRTGEGIRFRWFFNLGTLGGVAAALPDPARPLKPQLLGLVAGGPLASLLLAALAFLAFVPLEGRGAAYALILGALSLMVFLVTAAPFRAGGFMSDGLQLLQLTRQPESVERRIRLTTLMGMGLSGVRPRDLDATLLAQAQAHTGDEPMADIAVWFFSYGHALDGGDVAAAGEWLDRIEPVLDKYPDGFRQAITLELAIFEALHRRRLDVAEAWLARSRGGVVDASRRWLAVAAVAALAGRRQEALDALDKAQARLGRSMDASLAKLGADQITTLRRALVTLPDRAPTA